MTAAQRKRYARLKARAKEAAELEARAESRASKAGSRREDADHLLWEFERDHGLLKQPKPGSSEANVAEIFKRAYAQQSNAERVRAHPALTLGAQNIRYSVKGS